MSDLITKYRPQSFQDVVGQAVVVRSLQVICKKKDAHAFLFSGPYGTGKTTLARLVAKAYGCEDTSNSILEIDAATCTGIDSMRSIQDLLKYRPFGNSGQRAVILDEAHGLSKQAFDSLLKILEEPPAHVVWFFCTTNPAKIPKTVQSRCARFELKSVSDRDLGGLYDFVVEQENIDLPGDVGDLLIQEAKGSPRQLLSNLVVARTARTKKEAAELLKTAIETDATIELCRYLLFSNGKSWTKCMSLVSKLENDSPEGVRRIICNYVSKVLKDAKTDQQACFLLQVLDSFSAPYESGDMYELMVSLGRVIFSE